MRHHCYYARVCASFLRILKHSRFSFELLSTCRNLLNRHCNIRVNISIHFLIVKKYINISIFHSKRRWYKICEEKLHMLRVFENWWRFFNFLCFRGFQICEPYAYLRTKINLWKRRNFWIELVRLPDSAQTGTKSRNWTDKILTSAKKYTLYIENSSTGILKDWTVIKLQNMLCLFCFILFMRSQF